MLSLFDALYQVDFDGDLTAYLQPEEREDYQLALRYQKELAWELSQRLTGQDRERLDALLCNQQEAREEEDRLSFRRGLALGLKLGALGGR